MDEEGRGTDVGVEGLGIGGEAVAGAFDDANIIGAEGCGCGCC